MNGRTSTGHRPHAADPRRLLGRRRLETLDLEHRQQVLRHQTSKPMAAIGLADDI